MSDNTTLNAGSGGDVIAADDVSGVKFQRVKIATGADGVFDGDVSTALGLPVATVPAALWRVGFAEVAGSGLAGLAAAKLTLIQTGSGMAVSQSGGNLVITSGTTTNAETVIRSVAKFRGACLLRYKSILSQRIVNNTFRVELADLVGENLAYTINSATSVTVTFPSVNPFTSANVGQSLRLSVITGAAGIPGRFAIASVSGLTVTFTVASWPATGSGTLTLYGFNWLAAEYSGTTATTTNFDTQRRGWNSGATGATTNTSASPGHVAQINFDMLTAGFGDGLVASNTGYQFANRASRIENVPDDDVDMYVFIVVQNGSTAPASTTTWTMGFIQLESQGRDKIRVGSSDPVGSHALPVQVMGAPTIVVDTELPAAAAAADGAANPTTAMASAIESLFNGTTWDRRRNNAVVTMGDTGAKTTTFNGATQVNYNALGAYITVAVGTVSGTSPTLSVQLQYSYDGGTNFINVGPASTALTASGTITFIVYPTNVSQAAGSTPATLTTGATQTVAINAPLPRSWRLVYTIGGTTPSFTLTNAYASYVGP